MPTITLVSEINAPMERCFDLSRSIELHTRSTSRTGERAVPTGRPSSRTEGLLGWGEIVTWEAKHLGVRQRLTSQITGYQRPVYFCDDMLQGAFQSIHHEHHFRQEGEKTIMTDVFSFESPFGWLGQVFNRLLLTSYLHQFLLERNQMIKEVAESDKWQQLIPGN